MVASSGVAWVSNADDLSSSSTVAILGEQTPPPGFPTDIVTALLVNVARPRPLEKKRSM